jgi:cation diffusion facilitator family transporter
MGHHHNREVTQENEKKTLWVIIFTVITMIAEIACGYITHSMALLADGYHMGTHALALGLTFLAYVLIRKFKDSPLFPNGTEKIGVLTAYTSSLFLGFTGIWILFEAVSRLIHPLQIEFNEAILVAVIGLTVNAACILIMNGSHKHADEEKEDYNFKAAYYHILADALTSILAIAALIIGKYFNIIYFDPIVGMFGGILIIKWAIGLIKHTVRILTDMK